MKNKFNAILLASLFTLPGAAAMAQGLEDVIVEEYYTITQADADAYNNDFGGGSYPLVAGMKTYRIYVDMAPGYKLIQVYGAPVPVGGSVSPNPLDFTTTTTFWNDDNWGGELPSQTRRLPQGNAFDSYITINTTGLSSTGTTCGSTAGQFGVPRPDDTDGNLTLCNVYPGFTGNDGNVPGTGPALVYNLGGTMDFDALTLNGSSFQVVNESWTTLPASQGVDPNGTNRVLVAQLTTDGDLSFHINVQVSDPNSNLETYVWNEAAAGETVLPFLSYPVATCDAPVITGATSNSPICSTDQLELTVEATGTGPITYQWTGTGTIANGNTANASVANATTGNYTITVTNDCGSDIEIVPVTVNQTQTWYADQDSDGFGDPNTTSQSCNQPAGFVADNTDSCPLVSGKVGDSCDDGDASTENDMLNANCVCEGTPIVTFDCPGLMANIGDSCDDGDASTENDEVNANCVCEGTPIVTFDCPSLMANIGDSCDDGDASTENDEVNANCVCEGTPIVTFDCPGLMANIGDSCDDGDASTENDEVNASCVCEGTPIVTFDCPGLMANIGDSCDDNDPSTENDEVNANCVCEGTTVQEDDCLGVPGGAAQPGTPCDDGLAITINDTWTIDCQCVGTPTGDCTELVTIELHTDANGAQTSWEILAQGTMAEMCSGSGFPADAVVTEQCCLPEGCYILRVLDSAGDGIADGGYILRTFPENERIIDNRGNFSSGSVSAISGDQGFCLPIGDDHVLPGHCDKLFWENNEFLVASLNSAVSAEWINGQPNSAQDNNSGYEFWFFDPNGTYSYMHFRSHRTSHGYPATGPARAAHLRLNNWGAINHLPEGVLLNVRVRGVVNGTPMEWGPACRFKLDPVAAQCPPTKLMDIPYNQFLSCGETREFAPGSYVHAIPVNGASQYQFRFRQITEGFEKVRTSSNYFVQLWWAVDPLVAGSQYEVDVRAMVNGTWCPWGDICTLNIGTAPGMQGASYSSMAIEDAIGSQVELNMWPNPNRGDQLFFSLSEVPEGALTVNVDIFDLYGKRVVARTIAVNDGFINAVIDLQDALPAGMYMVNITVSGTTLTQRLVVQP